MAGDSRSSLKTEQAKLAELEEMIPVALHPRLREIMSRSGDDFTSNRRAFSRGEIETIRLEAFARLHESLRRRPAETLPDLESRWQDVIADFHENGYWGVAGRSPGAPSPEAPGPSIAWEFWAFLRTALFPTLVIKTFILFFGLMYSMYPGDGYGWGLILTIAASLSSFAWFIYKRAGSSEDET